MWLNKTFSLNIVTWFNSSTFSIYLLYPFSIMVSHLCFKSNFSFQNGEAEFLSCKMSSQHQKTKIMMSKNNCILTNSHINDLHFTIYFFCDTVQLYIAITLLHIYFPRPKLWTFFLQGYPVYSLPAWGVPGQAGEPPKLPDYGVWYHRNGCG